MATAKKTTTKKVVRATRAPKKAAAPKAVETPTTGKELAVYSAAGKQVSTIALPAELFGAKWRADLVHQVVTAMQANLRQNRAHTKDRSEVAGGGKKPWKQKGTGQARHGSSRSPIWRHGGITFGPRNERDYHEKISKKMRVQALASMLTKKASDGELILVDSFGLSAPKTADAKKAIAAIATAATGAKLKHNKAALIAMPSYDANVLKSFRNMGNVATEEARNLNPLSLATYKYLVIENPEKSFAALLSRITN